MNLSKKWLLDYVELDVTDKEFADELTLSGSKVESFEVEGAELSNIITGRIDSLERHPDSDHMWICMVNVGKDELIQIVTGAQNLKVGDVVPVAMDNSVVHGGQKIKKGKLRGQISNGMLCSLGELGLTAHDFPYAIEDGIFVLGDDCDRTLGIDIREAIGLNDTVTEFEITSNRPDCLSILGLAREAAATFKKPFSVKEPVVRSDEGDVNELLSVSILNPERCYRYCGAVVKNVRVKPSPRWMRERLRACGVRPINNIVDITNYVMLEYGQPMHAFDLRFLDGSKVIVRTAKNGETITTLDGVDRTLSDDMLVIADENKPVAVAGIMGGEYSGIMDDTNTIVFESACFNGPTTRITAKKLGMRTEASGRYEKELDPQNCMPALKRALELVQLLDAGDVINGIVDCDHSNKESRILDFKPEWTNEFIGINVSAEEQKDILERLDIKVDGDKLIIPSFRADLEHQADIAEEVSRFYGFHNIPNRKLEGVANASFTKEQKLERLISNTMLSCGFTEIATFSFISPKSYDKVRMPADSPLRNSVVITNPLGEDTSVMRTTAVPSMLDVIARNYNNRNAAVALFELAKEYIWKGEEQLPDENRMLTLGMYGNNCDFFSIKGAVEELLRQTGVENYDIEPLTDNPTYHPGRTAIITVDSEQIAVIGEIHPTVLANYGIGVRTYVAQVDFNGILKYGNDKRVYKQLPHYPATMRDLAFVCDVDIPVLKIEKAIAKAVGKILEEVSLFDVYIGSQIPEGMKSVAFNIRMRAADRTLTDEEADKAMKKAIKVLEEMGITLRS
ncbi:MAG: phenylalanine--tRNA ligase subunit beta [Faecalibacterium sp.]|nr:phenylalanine--tRNA ligase subunit beta [Ruminococcus sp.]MCM1392807.1 phenylalanine--tRNA ligase subunit beta [Ruminococcus sp.]MCM1484679.1 phenylalanine--tRNA ligase subunit beta [Faecalibacterium sp.]